jgi:hypothetical protein
MSVEPAIRDQLLAAIPSLRAFAISLCGNPIGPTIWCRTPW